MAHKLDSLLRPRSVAVLGASAREDSMGEWSLKNLLRGGFRGTIYPVNPRYEELQGIPCYQSLLTLPAVPEMVIFAVGDQRIEAALDEVIALGVRAAVIMSSLIIDDDKAPFLKARVQQKILAADMLVCGANGMGFYNFRDHTWACGFDSRAHHEPGGVSLISHSGSGMSGIVDCEERMRTNLVVSTGNELSVTMDQYLDFALELPETKTVGLFIETARNPAGFRAALQKAVDKKIPIVAIKVGRTAKSAELAVSHSGAIAGDDAAYAALFDRYGVYRVDDMDEFATALILFSELTPLGPGGLVTLHDSGGERQLIVDLADDAGVPLTELTDESVAALKGVLDPELPAVNPLDAWSRGGEGATQQMIDCLTIMMRDVGAAMGAAIHDRAPDGKIYESYVDYIDCAHAESGKPAALVAARQGTGLDPLVVDTSHRGLPVLDGVKPFLKGVRGLMDYRDFKLLPPMDLPSISSKVVEKWRQLLSEQDQLGEAQSLEMLRDFGVPASDSRLADSSDALQANAKDLGFPVVIKTAMADIAHKSEHAGVVLNIADSESLIEAYQDLDKRLGPNVIIAAMAPSGIEMILGSRLDPQFGPVVILGFGGILAEVLKDVVFALPPFDAAYANRRLSELKLGPILEGVRGANPAAIDEFCRAAAKFSVMIDALGKDLREVDVNPVIVSEHECIAVDALVVSGIRE